MGWEPVFGFLPLPGFFPLVLVLAVAPAVFLLALGSLPSPASSLSLPNGMAWAPPKGLPLPLLPFFLALATRSFLALAASLAGIFMSAIGL